MKPCLPAGPSVDDECAVLFTSGATGPAKGVVYTHRQAAAQLELVRATYGLTDRDRFVAAFAPFAILGPALGIGSAVPDIDVTAPGSLTAAAYVSDIVPKGVLWTNFAYPDQWCNNVAPRFMHPVNPVTPFKLARTTLTKIGTTDLAQRISFLPRNIAPKTT